MTLLFTHCARNHPQDSSVEWCFSDFDVMSHAPDWERDDYWKDWLTCEFEDACYSKGEYLAGHFLHPKYKRVQGRPVMYRGNADSLLYYRDRFNVTPWETQNLITKGSGENIYWVATNTKREVLPLLKSWGFSAFTEYLTYPAQNTWADAMVTYRRKWSEGVSIARSNNLKYWIPVTTGFDSRAWYDHPSRFIPTPEQFEAHVREAREFAQKNFDATDGHINVEAWNEYGEGSVLEPMYANQIHNGDSMLQAFKRACA